MSLTYSKYLRLDELLDLQTPLSEGPEHDEMLFIVIHQVYELWFKQLLHELDRLGHLLRRHSEEDPQTSVALHTLKRSLTILKTMVAQVDILETMTPMSFNSFRARLETASGFQSPQFREMEFVLGLRNPAMLRHHESNPAAHARLEQRLQEPTLYQHFLYFLSQHGYTIPGEAFEVSADSPPYQSAEVRTELIRLYRQDARLTQVCERLVDLDEGLQEWRYRHVKMVERTLGAKIGTGGSEGVSYLMKTLMRPVFPDLWAIRSEL